MHLFTQKHPKRLSLYGSVRRENSSVSFCFWYRYDNHKGKLLHTKLHTHNIIDNHTFLSQKQTNNSAVSFFFSSSTWSGPAVFIIFFLKQSLIKKCINTGGYLPIKIWYNTWLFLCPIFLFLQKKSVKRTGFFRCYFILHSSHTLHQGMSEWVCHSDGKKYIAEATESNRRNMMKRYYRTYLIIIMGHMHKRNLRKCLCFNMHLIIHLKTCGAHTHTL